MKPGEERRHTANHETEENLENFRRISILRLPKDQVYRASNILRRREATKKRKKEEAICPRQKKKRTQLRLLKNILPPTTKREGEERNTYLERKRKIDHREGK